MEIAPALRADIGIAMGARGTDVARESADLVSTDADLSSIAGGVLAVHVPTFGTTLIPASRPPGGAFDFARPHPIEWIVAITTGFVSVTWFEVYKRRKPPAA